MILAEWGVRGGASDAGLDVTTISRGPARSYPEEVGHRVASGADVGERSDVGEPPAAVGLDAAGTDDVFGDVSEFAVGVLADPA